MTDIVHIQKNKTSSWPSERQTFSKVRWKSRKNDCQLNEKHQEHLIFFDEEASATIQDAADDLIKSFASLEIKKSRVVEFIKEECQLSFKVVCCQPSARNCERIPQACAVWAEEWMKKVTCFFKNCVFLDEPGFDINMHWSRCGSPAISKTPSSKAHWQTVIEAISAFDVIHLITRTQKLQKEKKSFRGLQKEKHLRIEFVFLKVLRLVIICNSLTIQWISWMRFLKRKDFILSWTALQSMFLK